MSGVVFCDTVNSVLKCSWRGVMHQKHSLPKTQQQQKPHPVSVFRRNYAENINVFFLVCAINSALVHNNSYSEIGVFSACEESFLHDTGSHFCVINANTWLESFFPKKLGAFHRFSLPLGLSQCEIFGGIAGSVIRQLALFMLQAKRQSTQRTTNPS